MQKEKTIQREWYLIDAKDRVLGRLATQIATLLRGKNLVDFAPNLDNGANVVIINADKFILTGRKVEQKRYYRHTGYLGHLKEATVSEMIEKKPGEILRLAVAGMLPKNRLQKNFMKRLHVFAPSEHPYNDIKFKTLNK